MPYKRQCGAFIAVTLLLSLAGCEPAYAEDLGLTTESPLADYLRVAAEQNPAIAVARERYRAALERVTQAGGWPDPVVRYTYFARELETALGPQKHRVGLQQRLPFVGKLGLRAATAGSAADGMRERYRATHHAVLAETSRAYYEYAYLSRAIAVTRENLSILGAVEAVVRSRYATGRARHAHVIKAQLELAALEDRLRSLEDRRTAAAEELRAALGVPRETILPWPVPLVDPRDEIVDDEVVLERIRTENPELRALEHETARAELALALARRNRFPDITVGVENIRVSRSGLTSFRDSGEDAWIASVSVPLPIFMGKYNAAIREAGAQRRAQLGEQRDQEHNLVASTERLLFELRDAGRQVELYQTSLIPMAEAALESSLAGFRAAAVGFLDVLDAERALLRFQLDLVRARADRGQRVAELLARMGTSPTGVPEPPELEP